MKNLFVLFIILFIERVKPSLFRSISESMQVILSATSFKFPLILENKISNVKYK
ncbi:MAG: hypothetical protein BMS9Abin39_0830 [Ignavibacteria bacterium]|nr:MAG: hypothetical protein BMS9Abin39_0830 [Ignavibacteria bacterium]